MEHEDLISGRDFTRRYPQPERAEERPVELDPLPAPLEEHQPDNLPPPPPNPWVAAAALAAQTAADNPGPGVPPGAPLVAPLSRSFLTPQELDDGPSSRWGRFKAKLGFSGEVSEVVKAEQADVRAISRLWVGPRTIAIANPKGGAAKTPTTIALSALLARRGGSGVLAWCNNTTRGSLGWRTEPNRHQATVLDLLPVADELLHTDARVADLARFVHHQSEDRYDVLPSAAHLLSNQQRITEEDFDAIWRVVTKYYRLTFVDSGNEETAPNWTRMIDRSDVLVVPMANRRDHAEAAREMLLGLRSRDARSAHLVENAVVIVSEASPDNRGYVDELVREFGTERRDVVVVPHDPALGADHIRYGALRPSTQRAYLRAAAAVAARLDHAPPAITKDTNTDKENPR